MCRKEEKYIIVYYYNSIFSTLTYKAPRYYWDGKFFTPHQNEAMRGTKADMKFDIEYILQEDFIGEYNAENYLKIVKLVKKAKKRK
jgi:hypothetical protein